MVHPFFSPSPRAFAHRGDSRHFPENTLPAFHSASEMGADCIETDVHLTSDGQIVMCHDEALTQEQNCRKIIASHTLKELRDMDAGYHFTPDNGNTFPFRDSGIKISTLDETLEALPGMKFNVDLKPKSPELVRRFAACLQRHRALDRVLCASFHDSNLRIFRELVPDGVTSCGRYEAAGIILRAHTGTLFLKSSMPAMALQVPPSFGILPVIESPLLRRYHHAGLYVHVWTVNNREQMEELFDRGVDGIMTDRLDVLLEVVAQRE